MAGALFGVVLVAAVACAQVQPSAPSATSTLKTTAKTTTTSVSTPAPAKLPPVTGGGVRALWQGAPWAYLTFDGATLLGVGSSGSQPTKLHAVAAATGKPLWTLTMPKSESLILGLVPAGGVIVVEIGHIVGVALPAVDKYVGVDVKTGKTRWSAPVGGAYQSPPIATAGKFLLTGDTTDAVTGRIAATGKVVWRDPRPAGCGPANNPVTPGLGLAADGSLVGASFYCGRRVVVRRLDPATGKARWTWRSPAVAAKAGQYLALTAAAGDGGLLLLSGMIGPPPAAQHFTSALPYARSWPAAFGPNDEESTVLALAASNGHPLWTELGGQQQTFSLTADAVCEVISAGLECRSDPTGSATMPTLLTGVGDNDRPDVIGDEAAGLSDGLAAVTIASAKPGGTVLRVLRVRGGATVAQVRIAIAAAPAGSNLWAFAVGAAPLGLHTIVVLLRRVDLPGDGGRPVLALAVRVPADA